MTAGEWRSQILESESIKMRKFMDEDFLLQSETARHLFHDIAEHLPLVDYHCHISAKDICEDRRFDDLAQAWLGGRNADGSYFGDHYKWRIMRACGVPEKLITGDADGSERIHAFAQSLERAAGNPMIHWCNLELKRFFGWEEPLCPENAAAVYAHCSKLLREDPALSVHGILRKFRVAFVGTTDDPTDNLQWHESIATQKDVCALVCPSFRPDKALNIGADGFIEYMGKLAESAGRPALRTVQQVCEALSERLEAFKALGCRASDHGLDSIPFRPAPVSEVERIFSEALAGKKPNQQDIEKYQTHLLLHLSREYHRLDIAMQLHYSCMRNVNARMYAEMGSDTGYDMIARQSGAAGIVRLLSALDAEGKCPKTILYSLDPADNAILDSVIGCFSAEGVPGKFQHGSAWWFNDTLHGMYAQLESLASIGVLGNFIGMLTDSRSFLSYPRHEYFRRILCNYVGRLVENGEYPPNEGALKRIIEGICCQNAMRYFSL